MSSTTATTDASGAKGADLPQEFADPALRALYAQGKDRGFLMLAEVREALEAAELPKKGQTKVLRTFHDNAIEVREDETSELAPKRARKSTPRSTAAPDAPPAEEKTTPRKAATKKAPATSAAEPTVEEPTADATASASDEDDALSLIHI